MWCGTGDPPVLGASVNTGGSPVPPLRILLVMRFARRYVRG